jgi:hypothetical protein
MSKSPYDAEYPVNIDLGRKVPDYGSTGEAPEPARKTRIIYPTLYIEDSSDLGKLQRDGWALIHYHRTSLTIRDPDKDDDDKNKTAASLDVMEICLPDSDGDLADEFAKFAKSKGVTTGTSDDKEDE